MYMLNQVSKWVFIGAHMPDKDVKLGKYLCDSNADGLKEGSLFIVILVSKLIR